MADATHPHRESDNFIVRLLPRPSSLLVFAFVAALLILLSGAVVNARRMQPVTTLPPDGGFFVVVGNFLDSDGNGVVELGRDFTNTAIQIGVPLAFVSLALLSWRIRPNSRLACPTT